MRNELSKNISREELYELIWSKPASKLAKELGISDVGLGKMCRRMEVPKPALGYWRKVEVGGRVPKRPALKQLSPKGQTTVTINPRPEASEVMKMVRQASAVPFPDTLVDPHRLTTRTFASFNKAKADDRGLLISRNKIHLDIHVTQELLQRSCLIMDTLIKALESDGHKVRTSRDQPVKTVVEVDGESIEISLGEKVRRQDHKPSAQEKLKYKEHYWVIPQYDYLPTGKLSLNIHEWKAPRKSWSDGKRQRLESCLGQFIQALKETAICIKVAREQRRLDEIRWKEEEKRRQERERLAHIEKKKAEKLIADANSWHQSERIRSYIDQMETIQDKSDELSEWIVWAKRYSEAIDPLCHSESLPFTVDESQPYYW